MMETQFRRAMYERVVAVEAAGVLFPVPPGGKAVFPTFDDFSTRMLKIAGGETCALVSIVFPENAQVRTHPLGQALAASYHLLLHLSSSDERRGWVPTRQKAGA